MAKLPTMTSMELDDEDSLDAVTPMPMPSRPDFPYGLRICLTDKEFDKLKLDPSQAEVGGIFHMFALARITSVSSSQDDAGPRCRVEAQIEDLMIRSEDEENAQEGVY